jgi:hypothetical protein
MSNQVLLLRKGTDVRTQAKMFSSGVGARRGVGIRLSSAAIAAAALLIALPAAASAVVNPPTLSSAFTPASIGSGGTTALSFTITNPNASALSGVAFTDTLPAGIAVDNPNGLTGTCGSTSTLTADAGSSTIALTGGKLTAAGTTGATCTLQVSVTSTTAGSYQNSTGQVSSTEGGAGNGDTQTLAVFGLPTVSVTSPKENAVFTLGQKVIARYTCQDAFGAPGLNACSGDADSGTAIDTSTDGPNTFSVSAISNDGAITTQTIDYVVLPDNRFTVSKLAGHIGGQVTFKAKLPDAGKLTATLLRNGKALGQTIVKTKSDGTQQVTIKPNGAFRKAIRTALKAKHPKPISVKLTVSFTPFFGKAGKTYASTLKIKP